MGHRVQQPKHLMGISGKQLRENESENSPHTYVWWIDTYVRMYAYTTAHSPHLSSSHIFFDVS